MSIWYDKEAYQLLKKCSDAKDLTEWNEYRKTTNYSPINLRFADLRNFYLQKAELQSVDLRGSRLENANFYFADVEQMRFITAVYSWIFFGLFFLVYLFLLIFIIQKDHYILFSLVTFFSLIIAVFSWKNFSRISLDIDLYRFVPPVTFLILVIFIFRDQAQFDRLNAFGEMFLGIPYGIPIKDSQYFTALFSICVMIIIGTVLNAINRIEYANQLSLSFAKNPEKAIGYDKNCLGDQPKSASKELSKEIILLEKRIELARDDEKENLQHQLDDIKEQREFYKEQEKNADLQKTRIENVISELQAPYEYIHQTITKIEWHNFIYYSVIFGMVAFFLYAIIHGYIEQRVLSFTALFTKDMLPSFGTIFGVILFYGTPILLGISLVIYFISQINKNIDKITELQEQERNIKQIASTIKAKAQIGMSDEEFVKETKSLIQKYQEGMMAGMFNKEKISDKEDKSSSSMYREKLIANGVSKLLMQALKK